MSVGDIETVFSDGLWCNRVEGLDGFAGKYLNRADAALIARESARATRVHHIVRDLDGTICAHHDYSVGLSSMPGPALVS
jgi:hypothetical protein